MTLVKTLLAEELNALCVGLDNIANQIGCLISRLSDTADSKRLIAEALALERNVQAFRMHLRQYRQST